MTGVLAGIKVIDMGHVVAAPVAGATLADWGAEVVKVEPLAGEISRNVRANVASDQSEFNWNFQYLNRNKKSLALDLKTEPGREILYRLIKESDIFISNYESSALAKLQVNYEVLRQFNPRLIYGLLTGYGTEGPDKNERAFDFSAGWARSGAMYMIGEPGSTPAPQRGAMMDMVTAAHIVGGITAALFHRERTGEGQKLELSLYHSSVWTMAHDIHSALVGKTNLRHDRSKPPNPLSNSYRTKDGRWFWLAMLQSDLSWPDFCRAISKSELQDDLRFNSLQARWENSEELVRTIEEIIATKSMAEWETIFRENNCIYGRVATPDEVITDPQAIANNFFVDLHHPDIDTKVIASPVKFCQNPASVRGPAPEVGQHTEEMLLDLGYSWDDITQLKEKGVIL